MRVPKGKEFHSSTQMREKSLYAKTQNVFRRGGEVRIAVSNHNVSYNLVNSSALSEAWRPTTAVHLAPQEGVTSWLI